MLGGESAHFYVFECIQPQDINNGNLFFVLKYQRILRFICNYCDIFDRYISSFMVMGDWLLVYNMHTYCNERLYCIINGAIYFRCKKGDTLKRRLLLSAFKESQLITYIT